jgi:tetratricopeptide (TPR) repeat protein
MKARHVATVALIALMVNAAGAAESQGTQAGWRQRLTQVTAVVKVTINRWLGYWTGEPQPQAPQPAQNLPQQPAKKTEQAATAPATPTAAPAATPATAEPVKPVAKQASAPQRQETPEQAKLRSTPIFTDKKHNSTLEDIRSVHNTVAKTPVLAVRKAGVQGTSNLPKTKTGVPYVDFSKFGSTRAKNIPRLDIGTENEISAKDFAYGDLNWNLNAGSEFQRLPLVPSIYSHELSVALRVKGEPVLGPRQLQSSLKPLGKRVDQAAIEAIGYKLSVGEEFSPKPYRPFTEEELKLAAALILFSRGSHCHMVMGIFNQIKNAPKTKTEATYHLGACADQLEMNQAAYDNLSYVVAANDADYSALALELLAKDLPMIYEKDFYKLAKSVPNFKAMINDKNRDQITYRMAKGAYRMADYKTSIVYADQVAEASDLYSDARMLSAMNSFALGEKGRALKKLEEVWKLTEKRTEPNTNIRALAAVNMARMYFSQGKFGKALESYMLVPKDHPFWVQALIEQGWTQLALEDFSGAIGNMYSLHSPYFRAVYQPESFVVRTIGYLNICQYGDAYKTLTWMEKDYREWHSKLEQYLEGKGSEPLNVYKTVKSYIQGKSSDNIEGVPFQVWREMARRKDFLNIQTALNDKTDESRRYEGVNEKIKKEKAGIRTRSEQAKRRFDDLKAKIARTRVDRSLIREVPQWQASMQLEKDLIIGLRYQLAILEQGRQGYLNFQNSCQQKLDSETASLSVAAGKGLMSRAKTMREEMNRVLENNEFLRYEVFSGSGENIRYQVAGGEVATANRVPAHIKPTKMMNWSFDGEFWEDEIGSYRSSLQNNCPKSGEQAALIGN